MPPRTRHTITPREAAAFARRLKIAREKAGLTQEQWAQRHRVSTRTVARWEAATTEPLSDAQVAMMAGVIVKSKTTVLTEKDYERALPECAPDTVWVSVSDGLPSARELEQVFASASFVSSLQKIEDTYKLDRGALVDGVHAALVAADAAGLSASDLARITAFFVRSDKR